MPESEFRGEGRFPPVLLFSASPRRRELMGRLGIPFEAIPVDADETPPAGTHSSEDIVRAIALRKLESGLAIGGNSGKWGIAADTMVEGPGGLLGKPANAEEAAAMLAGLSGRTHAVHSGLAVFAPRSAEASAVHHGHEDPPIPGTPVETGTVRTACYSTKVTFRRLRDSEIRSYVDSKEWIDVAGGYRIQGLGAVLVARIEGLWSTVVGLPLAPLYAILTELSYPMG